MPPATSRGRLPLMAVVRLCRRPPASRRRGRPWRRSRPSARRRCRCGRGRAGRHRPPAAALPTPGSRRVRPREARLVAGNDRTHAGALQCGRTSSRSGLRPTRCYDGRPTRMSAERRGWTGLVLAASIVAASPWNLTAHAAQDGPAEARSCLAAPTAICLFAEAERVASSISHEFRRVSTLAAIAAEYGHAAIENAALKARLTLLRARLAVPDRDAAPPDLLAFAWSEIARTEARLGDLEDAFATASGIDDEEMRYSALVSIAGIQAAENDIVGALLSAARISDAAYHALALREIARAQVQRGDLAGSLETANDIIGPPWVRDGALLNIALTLAHAGHGSEALEAAAGIDRGSFRAWVASLAAAKAGSVERALRIASGMSRKLLKLR